MKNNNEKITHLQKSLKRKEKQLYQMQKDCKINIFTDQKS